MLWLSSSSSSINKRGASWPHFSGRASKHAYPCAVASGSLFHPARRLHTRSPKTAGCEKQQKPLANKGHFPIHLGPLPDHCRTPSQATRQPSPCPRSWQGGLASPPHWMLDVGCCSRFKVQGSSTLRSTATEDGLRRMGPPVNALGASARRRAAAPAPAEALPSRLVGRRSDESEGKGFGKGGGQP
jgi:hypothetical protein